MVAEAQPEWIVVQADTTSAMVGAVSGFYHYMRVAHVEAGLRTYDVNQPFPEECNRRVIALVADVCFAPTERAADNLRKEGNIR